MLGGFGSAFFFCTSMTLVTELFDSSTRGRALGIYQAIEFAGTFVGSIIGGFVANLVGYANTFYVCLALEVPTFLLALFSSDLKRETGRRVTSQLSRPRSYAALKNFTLVAVGIAAFLRLFDEQGVINTILPIYANQFLGIDVALIGIVMGAKAAGYVSTVLVAGVMCDVIGRKRTLLLGIGLASVAVFLLGGSKDLMTLMAFAALAGAGSGMIMVPLPALVAESVPSSLRGTAIGTFRTMFDLGAIVGPVSMTVVLGLAGPTICFYVAAAVVLAGVLPAAFIREKSR
jgi:MFS family permease